MTLQLENWWPNTCNCGFVIQYDDTDPARATSFNSVLVLDSPHSALTGQTAYNTVLDENNRMSKVLQGAIDNLATQLSSTGTAGGTLKNGIQYNFTLTGTAPNRVLNVSFSGITLTTAQKRTAQTWCNNNIGVGKVVVN